MQSYPRPRGRERCSPDGDKENVHPEEHGIRLNKVTSAELVLFKENEEFLQRREAKRQEYVQKRLESYDYVQSIKEGQVKSGYQGGKISLTSNYITIQKKKDWVLYHYHVDFCPPPPRILTTRDKKMIFRTMTAAAGFEYLGAFIFDGHSLWSATKLRMGNSDNSMELNNGELNKDPVTIKVKFVSELPPGDLMYLQFYSILVRKCFTILNLDLMGRHFYDGNAAIMMGQYKLELWPGFITSMKVHEGGLLYCIETTHKVVRMDNIFDFMQRTRADMQRRGASMDEVKEALKAEIVGTIVVTTHNNRTFRIDDISWLENPSSTFTLGDAEKTEISYVDYFKERYDVEIVNTKQPLLVSNPKKADIRRGHKTPVKLVPELCRMTGLTPEMKSNFQLMKSMGQHLFQEPQKKAESISHFVNRLNTNIECRKEVQGWGLNINPELVNLDGRVISKEQILFGNDQYFPVDQKGDFTLAFRSNAMVESVPLRRWIIIFPQRVASDVENLIRTMQKVGNPLGFIMSRPQMVELNSVNTSNYVDAIQNAVNTYGEDKIQLIFVILPAIKTETYSAVKSTCCVNFGIPSQCFLGKNLKAKGLMSIATKVVVQMNAKLGGQPWNTRNPLAGLMIIGFDVHHGGKSGGSKRSVGAMTCTITESHGRYFSTTSWFSNKGDLVSNMAEDIDKCINAWREANEGAFPARIILYREGVGEGELYYVYNTELAAINTKLQEVYQRVNLEIPKFTFIVCTKRINTRVFMTGRNGYENPPPGTIFDTTLTKPERWDFFLVAQNGRQGTVSPTNYNVLYDSNNLNADKIQRLTFKQCHLFYNWSGTVAVPAVCQYARKLAEFTAIALKAEAKQRLTTQLYFL